MDRSEDGRRTLGWRSGAGRDGRTGRTDGWVGRRSTMNGSLTRMPERAISRSVPSLSSSASWLLGAFRVRADSLRTELNSELTFDPRCLSESTQPYSLPDVDTSPPARTPPTSLTNNLVKYCTIEPWPGTLCVLPEVSDPELVVRTCVRTTWSRCPLSAARASSSSACTVRTADGESGSRSLGHHHRRRLCRARGDQDGDGDGFFGGDSVLKIDFFALSVFFFFFLWIWLRRPGASCAALCYGHGTRTRTRTRGR